MGGIRYGAGDSQSFPAAFQLRHRQKGGVGKVVRKTTCSIMAIEVASESTTRRTGLLGGYEGALRLSGKPKILFVCDSREKLDDLFGAAADDYEWVVVRNPMRALAYLTREQFDGVYVSTDYLQQAFEIGKLLQNEQILEGMPDGVVLLDSDNTIIWEQRPAARVERPRAVVGREFLHGAWAARRFSAPTSAPSTRPWPPGRRPVRRCAAATTATSTSTPPRSARSAARRAT